MIVPMARDQGRRHKHREQRPGQQGGPRTQDEEAGRAEHDRYYAQAHRERRRAAFPALPEAAQYRDESGHDRRDGGPPGDVVDAPRGLRSPRQQGGDQRQRDRILVNVDEDQRRRERDERPANQPAGGDQEVEPGQAGGRRPQPGQLPVAVKRGQHEDEEVGQSERQCRGVEEVEDRQRDEGRRHQPGEEGLRDGRPARECVDEGGEVEAERQDPQERYRGHIRGDVSRDTEQERAGHRGQREDAPDRQRPGSAADGRFGVMPAVPGGDVALRGRPPQDEQEGRKEHGSGAPQPRLAGQPQQGFDHERKRDQRARGARIRGGVQKVGVGRRRPCAGAREPVLDERGQGRDGNERQPERAGKRSEQPQRGRKTAGRLAEEPDRASRSGERDPRPERDDRHQLRSRRRGAGETVGQGVAAEQRRLEEHHGGVPYGGRTPKDRQDTAHRQGLNPEYEPGACEDDGSIEPDRRQSRTARKRPVNAARPDSCPGWNGNRASWPPDDRRNVHRRQPSCGESGVAGPHVFTIGLLRLLARRRCRKIGLGCDRCEGHVRIWLCQHCGTPFAWRVRRRRRTTLVPGATKYWSRSPRCWALTRGGAPAIVLTGMAG